MLLLTLSILLLTSYQALCGPPNNPSPPSKTGSGECTAYENLPAICVNAKDCFTLRGLTKSSSADAKQQLGSLKCGSKQNEKLCCVQCGKLASNTRPKRISGGNPAKLGSWPWIVALSYADTTTNQEELDYLCAGTLISDQWVLTGATCISQSKRVLKGVRVGELNVDDKVNDGASPQDIPVDKIIAHPQYSNSPSIFNDIGLIKLKYPVKFSSKVLPICILQGDAYKKNDFYAKKSALIAGWGVSGIGEAKEDHLQEATVTIFSTNECKKNYTDTENVLIDEKVLCASGDGKDACQGDSGGPLVLTVDGIRYVAGIISFGSGCASDQYPGVYTNVAQYTEWINSQISAN